MIAPATLLPLLLLVTTDAEVARGGAAAVAAGAPELTTTTDPIAQALVLIDDGDYEGAIASLRSAPPPLAYEQVVKRAEALGTAHAFLDDGEAATAAYRELLVLEPKHVMPYTLSPKATFHFERARAAMKEERTPANLVRVDAPPAAFVDEPVRLTLATLADPLAMLSSLRVCHRVKGTLAQRASRCIEVDAPRVGRWVDVEIPARASPDGQSFVLAVSVQGFNARGDEVYRGPSPDAPIEVPVGFAPPAPWYASPLVWAPVAVAAGVAGVFLLAAYGSASVPVYYEVREPR